MATFSLAACSTVQTRTEWDVDPKDTVKMAQLKSDYKECGDFAYRSKVAGSRYTEADIHTSCLQRRGYQFKTVEVGQ